MNGSSSSGSSSAAGDALLDVVTERLEQARRVLGGGDALGVGLGRAPPARVVRSPMRRRPGIGADLVARTGRVGGGAAYGSPGIVAREHVEHGRAVAHRCA